MTAAGETSLFGFDIGAKKTVFVKDELSFNFLLGGSFNSQETIVERKGYVGALHPKDEHILSLETATYDMVTLPRVLDAACYTEETPTEYCEASDGIELATVHESNTYISPKIGMEVSYNVFHIGVIFHPNFYDQGAATMMSAGLNWKF